MKLLDARSLTLRRQMLDALYDAGRGHLPSALSCLEIVRVLYDKILRVRPAEPAWPERDRFILSKGHGCLALYTILADKNFFPKEELSSFCAFGSRLGGHPERLLPGVEAATGSLGHGPSLGIGMALALRLNTNSSRVFVLCGDGETNEGSVWEACLSAAMHGLDTFTLIIDRNGQQSWDDTEKILPLEPYAEKFRAFGFNVLELDGHDLAALEQAFSTLPLESGKPSCLICHTVKGKGFPTMERNLAWHHKTKLNETEYTCLLADLETAGRKA